MSFKKEYKVRFSKPLPYGNTHRINISFSNPGIQNGCYQFEVVGEKLYIYPPSSGHKVTNNRTSLENVNIEKYSPFVGEYNIIHLEAETNFVYVLSSERKPLRNERKSYHHKDKTIGHEGEELFKNIETSNEPELPLITYEPEVNPVNVEPMKVADFSSKLFKCFKELTLEGDNANANEILDLWLMTRGKK